MLGAGAGKEGISAKIGQAVLEIVQHVFPSTESCCAQAAKKRSSLKVVKAVRKIAQHDFRETESCIAQAAKKAFESWHGSLGNCPT